MSYVDGLPPSLFLFCGPGDWTWGLYISTPCFKILRQDFIKLLSRLNLWPLAWASQRRCPCHLRKLYSISNFLRDFFLIKRGLLSHSFSIRVTLKLTVFWMLDQPDLPKVNPTKLQYIIFYEIWFANALFTAWWMSMEEDRNSPHCSQEAGK